MSEGQQDIDRVRGWVSDGTLKRVSPLDLHPGMKIHDADHYARIALSEIDQEKQVGAAARSRIRKLVIAVDKAIESERT